MSNARSYKDSWNKIGDLPGGGQGTTLKAISKNDQTIFSAVKILNKQNDEERRARMYREAAILSTISHSNIPKLIDSNTEFWKDKNYKLFIATEFIDGVTLSKLNFSALSLNQKINLIIKIGEVITFCHKKGIVHRDIKPDNIVINSEILMPYVIDFGISFNFNDTDDDNLTPDGQQLGNRFLILPEQKIGEVGKRDYRTDTCCLVGLFFYILTEEIPKLVIDEHNRKPHQRDSAKEKLKQFPEYQLSILNNIFDIGFNQLIDKRWQTVDSFIKQLHILINAQEEVMTNRNNQIHKIKSIQESQDYKEKKLTRNLLYKVDNQIGITLEEIGIELGEEWSYAQSGGILPSGQEYKNKYHPYNSIHQSLNPNTTIHAFLTGNELVIQLHEGSQSSITEVLRHPILNEINWSQFKESLKNYWVNEISKKIRS